MRRWADELAALRQAAPDADRQWLARNSKRCPQCRAHIQARWQRMGRALQGPKMGYGADRQLG